MALTSQASFTVSADAPLINNTTKPSVANIQAVSNLTTTLKPFSANYVAFRSGNDVGRALLQLKRLPNKQYELIYESEVSRFFLSDKRYETTRFSNDGGDLMPLHYDYKRTGTGPNKEISIVFDPQSKKILVDDKQIDWNGEFDNQLFRVDFPKKLAQGIDAMQYDFINYRGEKRSYTLEVVASDNLSLPYGKITAIKVLIGRDSSRRVTFAWFAPSLNYNLVRLQQFKDEKEQGDMQLDTFAYIE
jgi:hypothetical protein